MRCLLAALVLVLFPLTAGAASLKDFDGVWRFDVATTVAESSAAIDDDEKGFMEQSRLVFDVKAGTMLIQAPDEKDEPEKFTLREETREVVVIEKDGMVLQLRPHGQGMAIGEMRDGKLRDVVYFKR